MQVTFFAVKFVCDLLFLHKVSMTVSAEDGMSGYRCVKQLAGEEELYIMWLAAPHEVSVVRQLRSPVSELHVLVVGVVDCVSSARLSVWSLGACVWCCSLRSMRSLPCLVF